MLTLAPGASAGEYKVEYEPLSMAEYEKHYREQQTCTEPIEVSGI